MSAMGTMRSDWRSFALCACGTETRRGRASLAWSVLTSLIQAVRSDGMSFAPACRAGGLDDRVTDASPIDPVGLRSIQLEVSEKLPQG